ncbi:MAG: diacylglycerol kinase family protein [Patescibacteria group bacterium]|jgi:diacylglycerol kinase
MVDTGRFLRSLRFAVKGIMTLAREEQSFRLQLFAAVVLTVLIFIFKLSRAETALLVVVAAMTLVLELLNGAVERLVDLFKPRMHEYAEQIKDMMAGAVLVSSVGALLAGVLVFWPHVFK